MAVPSPNVALTGGCTEIYQNTLYAYQEDAFQSLPLQPGGTWSQLSMGVSVNGSRCVLGTQDGDDVLYIVGGTATTDEQDYSGLQRYRFSDKSWQTIVFDEASVVQNRMEHGATFLNDSQVILVYAGYQDNSMENTSQTFTISTSSNPETNSYISNEAPPGMAPILLPWNSSHAMMAGGSIGNQQVWTFNPEDGWHAVNVVLPPDVPDMTQVQASLIQGDNSSKILELFDMTTQPNTVIPLLLSPGNDQAASKRSASQLITRDVDLTNWPPYNASLAPNAIRNGYNVAQTPSGLVVISGGATSGGDAITIFNQTGNTWVNAKDFFNPPQQSTSTASPSTSSIVPAAATSSAPAAAAQDTGNSSGLDNTQRTILGAVLGGVFGLIALAIIILLILRGLRQRQQHKRHRSSEYVFEKKPQHLNGDIAATGFDRGALSPAASNFSGASSPMRRHFARSPAEEEDENVVIPIEQQNIPHRPGPRTARSDEGWSQYFPTDTSSIPLPSTQGRSDALNDGNRLAVPRDTQYTENSDYSTSTNGAHISAEVAPLNLRDSEIPPSSSRDRYGDDLLQHSSVSAPDSWDPVSTSEGRSSFNHRPVSSLYDGSTGSRVSQHQPGERVLISRFPGVPSRSASIITPLEDDRGMRTMAAPDFGMRPTSAPRSIDPSSSNDNSKSRGSSRPDSGHVDNMSWLKLGSPK